MHVKAGLDPYAEVDPGSIIQLDGAEHARLRKMVVAEFTVRRVERLREYVREQVDRHLDAMLAKPGPADLVRDFALPIPSLVICELLGVPSADRELFQRQSSLLVSTDQSPDATRKAYHELGGYLGTLFAGKQRDPRDDLFSRLIVRAEYSGEPLDLDELIMLGLSLLVAGHETTANMIALSTLLTLLLLEHPEQRAHALADPPRVTG
ncbi:hypothetical protein [Amycolatopsis echigonensis]|uniref:hypothetical protein n=1 Tax=Amycolatopsis echigonensis TaxID=2576905 RepID=UPI001FCA1189|nr:hypothetical protein [Amycolatopsis niigatensis]